MKNHLRILIVIASFLLAASLPLQVNAALCPNPLPSTCTVILPVPYASSSATLAPLQSTSQVPSPLSPASTVYKYNDAFAIWLITCPNDPSLSSAYGAYLFGVNPTPPTASVGWLFAGDQCQLGDLHAPANPTVTLTLTAKQRPLRPDTLPIGTEGTASFTMTNPVYLSLTNLGYSPQLQTLSTNIISSDYQSTSYIFNGMPALSQHELWTWSAIYVNMLYVNSKIQTNQVQALAREPGTYITQSGGCTSVSTQGPPGAPPDDLNFQNGLILTPTPGSLYDPVNVYFSTILASDGYPVTYFNLNFLEAVTLAQYEEGTSTAWGTWNPLGLASENADAGFTFPSFYIPSGLGAVCGFKTLAGVKTDVYNHLLDGQQNLEYLFNYCFTGAPNSAKPECTSEHACPPAFGGGLCTPAQVYLSASAIPLLLRFGNMPLSFFGTYLACDLPASSIPPCPSGVSYVLGSPTSVLPGLNTGAVYFVADLDQYTPAYNDQQTNPLALFGAIDINRYLTAQLENCMGGSPPCTGPASQPTTMFPGGGGSSDQNTCEYTYTLNTLASLDYVKQEQIPFPLGLSGQSFETPILPYFVYNSNILNPETSNAFDFELSYDVFSPFNYESTVLASTGSGGANVIDPFSVNSFNLFLSSYWDNSGTYNGNLVYFNTGGAQVNLVDQQQYVSLSFPVGMLVLSPTSVLPIANTLAVHQITPLQGATTGGNDPSTLGGQYNCPNVVEPAGAAGKLTFKQVYTCAWDAGFRGVQLEIIVAIAYPESNFNAGDSSGLLGGSSYADPQGSNPAYWYNPSTCTAATATTWQKDPLCQYQWAYDEVEAYVHDGPSTDPSLCSNGPDAGYLGLRPPVGPHVFCYWGTYRNDQPLGGSGPADYCKYLEVGYTGENCPAGASKNQLGWNWPQVGFLVPGSGYGTASASGGSGGSGGGGVPPPPPPVTGPNPVPVAYTPMQVNSIIGITTPNSIASTPQGFIFVLGGTGADTIYVLKPIPIGYFNTSKYSPLTVPPYNGNFGDYQGIYEGYQLRWQAYWNNVLGLQDQSVYIISTISLTPILSTIQIPSVCTSIGCTPASNLGEDGFTPLNISADYLGDVYLLGKDAANRGWIIKFSNVVGGGGHLGISYNAICPQSINPALTSTLPNPTTNIGEALCENAPTGNPSVWTEIAVSPTGAQVYVAAQGSGLIAIYDGQTLSYQTDISLDYNTDNSLYTSAVADSALPNAPAVNIPDFLFNGGLYGINANCNPRMPPGCTVADLQMYDLEQEYENTNPTNLFASSLISTSYDYLDKADAFPGTPNNNFHHPVAIQDVNGYLYVLDQWYGETGRICTSNFGFGCVGGAMDGIRFNILTLRLINSSGVDVPVNPTYYDDLWYCKDKITPSAPCTSYIRFKQPSGLEYAPFGWILSANVTSNINALNAPSAPGTYDGVALCSGKQAKPISRGAAQTDDPTGCFQPDPSYQGTLLPVGPSLNNGNGYGDGTSGAYDNGECVPPVVGASMSVSFNNTVEIFIPNGQNNNVLPGQTGQWDGCAGLPISIGNNDEELIISKFDPENYTKQVGGLNYPPFAFHTDWDCYTTELVDTNINTQTDAHGNPVAGLCDYSDEVFHLVSPTYLYENPFTYDEDIGSYQTLTLEELASADINPASPSNLNEGGSGIVGINNQLSTAYSNQAGQPYVPGQTFVGQLSPTELQSSLAGYVLVPYSYAITVTWWLSNIGITAASDPSCLIHLPPALAAEPMFVDPAIGSINVYYEDTKSATVSSNPQYSQVESGLSYAQYAVNRSIFYQATTASIIAPQELFYNLLSNRQFGSIYINATYNAYTNTQGVVNAITSNSYIDNTFTQKPPGSSGPGYPGYAVINAQAISPVCVGPTCAPALTNVNGGANTYNINDTLEPILQNQPMLVTLFDWFKIPIYNWNIYLTLQGSTAAQNAYGYHRIVYVYNDRFNNSIYMPLDVDIANITQLTLNTNPSVSSTNANQTNIQVNGTAFWTPPFTTNEIPLQNAYIYLYYNANLNTIGYNAMTFLSQANVDTCVFANTIQPYSCQYANPISATMAYNATAGQYADGSYYITPNIITYNTAYNSIGGNQCSPPPNSLLYPDNQLFTLCNIYNTGSFAVATGGTTASTSQLPARCPISSAGKQQWCEPLFTNGTGYCTSQLGLFDIAQTNASGYFSTNVNACGFGFQTIVAQYYGTPGPEPILVHQSPIPQAADPSVPNSQSILFTADNYSWTPIQTDAAVAIGTVLLSLGGINALAGVAIILLVMAAAVLGAIMSRRKKAKQYKAKRNLARKMRNA